MSDETRICLGKRIKTLREKQGLSQRKFSLMVGIDRSYIIGVEHGRRNISIDNIEKIANGLGVGIYDLFS